MYMGAGALDGQDANGNSVQVVIYQLASIPRWLSYICRGAYHYFGLGKTAGVTWLPLSDIVPPASMRAASLSHLRVVPGRNQQGAVRFFFGGA